MAKRQSNRLFVILLVGDFITLGLITVIGFASHGTLGSAGSRLLTTFIPSVFGWLAAAPLIGAYRPDLAVQFRQLWRPVWSAALGMPFAAWLRGIWLNAAIQPIFVLVMIGVAMAGILIWRMLFCFLAKSWAKP